MSTHTEPIGLGLLFTQDVADPAAVCPAGYHSEPIGLLLLFSQCVVDAVPPTPVAAVPHEPSIWVEIKGRINPHRPEGLRNTRGW